MSTSTPNPSPFRPLNIAERAMITSLVQRGKLPTDDDRYNWISSFMVSYENMQGGFCICILLDTRYSLLYRGASRRSYKDSRNQLKGEMMAFRRAVLYSRGSKLTIAKRAFI